MVLRSMFLSAQLADGLEADGAVHQLDGLTSAVVAVDASRDHTRDDTAHASSSAGSETALRARPLPEVQPAALSGTCAAGSD